MRGAEKMFRLCPMEQVTGIERMKSNVWVGNRFIIFPFCAKAGGDWSLLNFGTENQLDPKPSLDIFRPATHIIFPDCKGVA